MLVIGIYEQLMCIDVAVHTLKINQNNLNSLILLYHQNLVEKPIKHWK